MPFADVSILISCYKKEEYLDECVFSVTEQTVRPKEIILAHDGCESPSSHIDATTLIYPKNMGVVKIRNEMVRFCQSKFIIFLDGDDKLPPDYIEKMFISIGKNDIAYPSILWWYGKDKNRLFEAPEKLIAKEMLQSCKIPVSCLIKKDKYLDLGGFLNYDLFEDWDMWLRAMDKKYKFVKANTYLFYRQTPNTRNRQETNLKKTIYNKIKSKYEIKRGKICLKSPDIMR
jgi:glycosyltransferase involved in cell wall biosynthesis